MDDFIGTPERISALRVSCLVCDRNRCVATYTFNQVEALARFKEYSQALDDDGDPFVDGQLFESLQVAHIIPYALTKVDDGSRLCEGKKAAIAILNMFDLGVAHLIEGVGINRPYNALTLSNWIHENFGTYKIFFEPVSDQERVRKATEQAKEAVTEANKQVKKANEQAKEAGERVEAAEIKLHHTASGYGPGAHTQAATTIKRKREEGEVKDSTASSSQDGGCGGGSSTGTTPNQSSLWVPAHARNRLYCTQACLLGLCHEGSPFDPACPNTPVHSQQGRWSHHHLSASKVCQRVRDRLARNLDDGCECLDKYGLFGATVVLFKITDPTYGYVFVAKGVQEVDAGVLADEARIYAHCRALQGTRIPVYLGSIDLVYRYPLRSMAIVSDMMFLSWAGMTLDDASPTRLVVPASVDLDAELNAAIEALECYGVEHDDIREANLAWNDEVGGIMVIDFDRVFLRAPAKKVRTGDMAMGG